MDDMQRLRRSKRTLTFFAFSLASLAVVAALPLIFSDVGPRDQELIIFETWHGVGAVTPDGREAIAFDYQELGPFNASHIAIAKRLGEEKYGCVDAQGRTVVSFEWDEIREFNTTGQAWALRENESCLIDSCGRVIDRIPVRLTSQFDFHGMAQATQNGRIGLVTRDGKFVCKPQFAWIGDFSSAGLAPVSTDGQGRLMGFIDRSGAMKIPAKWSGIEDSWRGGRTFDGAGWARVRDAEGKTYWIDQTGQSVLPMAWDQASRFVDFDDGGKSLAAVGSGDKLGYIDRKGEFVVPPQFVSAWPFDEYGMAAVAIRKNGRTLWGWIDRTGRFVIPPIWDDVKPFNNASRAIVTLDGKTGCIDRSGNVLVSPSWISLDDGRYGSIWPDNVMIAYEPESWKILDSSGRVVQDLGEHPWRNVQLIRTATRGWLMKAYYHESLATNALVPASRLPYPLRAIYSRGLAIVGAAEEWRLLDMNGTVIWTSSDRLRRGFMALALSIAALCCVAIAAKKPAASVTPRPDGRVQSDCAS